MFTKFEFIASLVDRGDEITFTYDEKKKKPNKDSLEDIDFGSKPNPLLEKRQYRTKAGYRDKPYASKIPAKKLDEVEYEFKKKSYGWAKKDFGWEKKDASYTPAYKRDKFKWSGPAKTTNKKGNSGLGYKVARKK